MKLKSKKTLAILNIFVLIALCVWCYLNYQSQGIVFTMFQGDKDAFLAAFDSMAQFKKILYVIVIIIIEVIIGFIPGPLVYPIVGIMVGPFWGSILIVTGNIIGSVINFFQGKIIWTGINDITEDTPRYMAKFYSKGAKSLFLLRLNPITSYDFLPYLAGGSGMRFWPFFFANTLGLIPMIIVFTYFGSEILQKYTWSLYAFLGFTVLFMLYQFGFKRGSL